MNIVDMFLINMLLMSVPLLIYMVYITTNRSIENREKNLFFLLALISSYFLMLHYRLFNDNTMIVLLSGIVITFIKLKDFNLFTLFILIMNLLMLNFPYILFLFYIPLLFIKNNKLFIIGYLFSFIIYRSINDYLLVETLFLSIMFLISIYILNLFYEKGIETLNTHIKYKELKKEKQIRLSLFKITHEIKNPIAVCKAYLDMFDTNNLEHSRKYIPIIKNEMDRILVLLQDFLLVNKTNMNCDIMDINMLIDEVSDKVKCFMDSNSINFQINTIDDEVFINGDYNRLCQVLINILKNSIEAESKNITLTLRESNNKLLININDDGTGISKEVMDKIYEPFYTTKRSGTGLGVSLSKEIINAHNGNIEYSSVEGSGTEVKIILPSYNL